MPDVTVTLTCDALGGVLGGAITLPDAITGRDIKVEPDPEPLQAFLSMLGTDLSGTPPARAADQQVEHGLGR